MKPRSHAISLVILALATIAPGASAQPPKPGGQIVHGSAQEPDRIWGPVTGLTVSAEIKEWVPGSHLVLVKNPSYWKPGRPYLDRIIYKIVPDANALLNQLENLLADLSYGVADPRIRLD